MRRTQLRRPLVVEANRKRALPQSHQASRDGVVFLQKDLSFADETQVMFGRFTDVAEDSQDFLTRLSNDAFVPDEKLAWFDRAQEMNKKVVHHPPDSRFGGVKASLVYDVVEAVSFPLPTSPGKRRRSGIPHHMEKAELEPGNPSQHETVRRVDGRVDDDSCPAHASNSAKHTSESIRVTLQVLPVCI
jgi:hypothetical protein